MTRKRMYVMYSAHGIAQGTVSQPRKMIAAICYREWRWDDDSALTHAVIDDQDRKRVHG